MIPRSVNSSVLAQHAEDAVLLANMRAHLTRALHVNLHHLHRLDDRLAAHLDRLTVAENDAGVLTTAALERPDSGEAFTATGANRFAPADSPGRRSVRGTHAGAGLTRAALSGQCSQCAAQIAHIERLPEAFPRSGSALRMAYCQCGITMTALAKDLGLSVSRVSRLIAAADRVAQGKAIPDVAPFSPAIRLNFRHRTRAQAPAYFFKVDAAFEW